MHECCALKLIFTQMHSVSKVLTVNITLLLILRGLLFYSVTRSCFKKLLNYIPNIFKNITKVLQ